MDSLDDTEATTPMNSTEHDDALREWARGVTTCAAATELLIRTGWATPGFPWIRTDSGVWVDFDAIPGNIGAYSGGEQRLLRIAASIFGSASINLGDEIAGVDRTILEHVLAALAHVQGETSEFVHRPDGSGVDVVRLPVAFDWPDPKARA